MARTTTPRTRRHRRSAAVGALLLISGLTAVAGGATPAVAASRSGVTLTLYSAQHEQTTAAMVAAFTKQTGIKVRVDNNDEDVLTAQIENEGSRSPADVFYTENSNWLQQLDDRGLLSKVAAATLASVPRRDSAPNGDWLGVSARISVLVYNDKKVKASQLPTSVMGLASPKWKGKLELAPSETDFWPIVSSIARANGSAAALAWLKAVKANAAGNDAVPDNETLVSDVSAGTTSLALINHYYYFRLQAEIGRSKVHAKIAFFAPRDPGYVEDISGAAVLRSSKHQAEAQQLLSFLTSKAGQTVLAHSESFEYPIRPGVAASPEMRPLSSLRPSSFTPAELGTGLNAKKLLQEAGLL